MWACAKCTLYSAYAIVTTPCFSCTVLPWAVLDYAARAYDSRYESKQLFSGLAVKVTQHSMGVGR